MKNRVVIIKIIALLIILVFASLFVMHIFRNQNVESLLEDDGESSKERERILEAIANFSKDDKKAEIIDKVKTDQKVISLNFQGLSDEETNSLVLDLLEKSNKKANFFISGNLVVENSKFVKKLSKKGHLVASNSLFAERKMDQYPPEELIENFIRANLIIKKTIAREADFLMCNSTKYTDEVLRAAYLAGNSQVIETSEFLSYQSFKDSKEVRNYIRNLEKGSIITIKMDGVLEDDEYDKPSSSSKAATHKKPGTKEEKEDFTDTLSPQEELINLVNWILKAIDREGYRLVALQDLKSYEKLETDEKDIELGEDDKIGEKESVEDNTDDIKDSEKDKVVINPNQESKKDTDDSELLEEDPKNNENDSEEDLEMGDLKEILNTLREENGGKKAKEYHTVYTTEKALSYTFYGIANTEVLDGVLENLDILNSKGSFFVNRKDLINNLDDIKNINDRGHEIGIALLEEEEMDFYSTLANILYLQEEISNITNEVPKLVRYPYHIDLDYEILEAISAADSKLIWDDLSVASSKVGPDGDLETVMSNIFGLGNRVVQRGYIIYYRMDYYKNPKLIPDLMLSIAKERIDTIAYKDDGHKNSSTYKLKSLGELIDGDKVYSYPVREENILPEIRNAIYEGQLASHTEEEIFEEIISRYIGNPDINNINTLPGFSKKELEEIDTSGVFTDDKVIFLTFDDWSSDKPINQLLYVLDKHSVKGSFFIRTNFMQNNPNILRAIAEEGHDIGNHSNHHLPMANLENVDEYDEDDVNALYYSLNEHEIVERKEDILIAHKKLLDVVGDVSVEGRPALTTMFRPPTLAMSRVGIEAIFDLGFGHIVSGDFSTHDYEDDDPEILVDKILNGMATSGGRVAEIQNGSILIMHMSDFTGTPGMDSNITAEALDIVIPILKSKGYKFARLSDYLR